MRALLFLSLSLWFAQPLQAQPQSGTFVEFTQQIEATLEIVQEEATNVAEEKHLLREVIIPAGDPLRSINRAVDPTVLIGGNVHLHIEETSFTLYLRSVNHHTEARLESHELNVSKQAKQQAKAFLQDVTHRATSTRG